MKRESTSHAGGPRKKALLAGQSATATRAAAIDHPVLQRFYPRLLTLRHYLLSVLPNSSKNRRRKLAQLGRPIATKEPAHSTCTPDVELGQLLDSIVIGQHKTTKTKDDEQLAKERSRDIETFTQQLSPPITGGTFRPGQFLQSEVGSTQLIFSSHQPMYSFVQVLSSTDCLLCDMAPLQSLLVLQTPPSAMPRV